MRHAVMQFCSLAVLQLRQHIGTLAHHHISTLAH